MVAILSITAALAQAFGYILYGRLFLQKAIRPNTASSLMFAYGTALLVVLEISEGATWHILALPITCAVMSIGIALLCLRKGATDPVDKVEAITFSADIWLTLLWAAIAFGYGDIAPFATGFLIAGNLTTITSFVPVLRSTWRNPERERPSPWVAWTIAYGLLTIVTIMADHGRNPALLIYPGLSVILHGTIATLSLGSHRKWVDAARSIYIARSKVHGNGMFAGRRFETGEPICVLSGRVIFGAVTQEGPNYIGLGPDVWIDPVLPLDHLNHRCEPNTAFGPHRTLRALRVIEPGEELTADYSTTEADPAWAMHCACGAPECRGTLHAIQRSFADADVAPEASPLMRLVWEKRRHIYRDGLAGAGIEAPKIMPIARPHVEPTKLQPVMRRRVRRSTVTPAKWTALTKPDLIGPRMELQPSASENVARKTDA